MFPNELYSRIFPHLKVIDFIQLSLVSRRFNSIFQWIEYDQKVIVKNFGGINLKLTNIKVDRNVTTFSKIGILQKLQRIKCLDLSRHEK
jgi:hypothetical protein